MCEEAMLKENVMDKLHDRRILVLGRDSALKEFLTKELQKVGQLSAYSFVVSNQSDIFPEDFVILTGTAGKEQKKPLKCEEKKYPWARKEKLKGEYVESWTEFKKIMDILQKIRQTKPEAMIFLSDSSIYGKAFRKEYLVREEDIGYLCHTDEDFQDAQCLRTLEHLCSRLARESGLNIKIARLQNPVQEAMPEVSEAVSDSDIVKTLLNVLLFGVPGEAYNVQRYRRISLELAEVSPLSPSVIMESFAKTENLRRKEKGGE